MDPEGILGNMHLTVHAIPPRTYPLTIIDFKTI